MRSWSATIRRNGSARSRRFMWPNVGLPMADAQIISHTIGFVIHSLSILSLYIGISIEFYTLIVVFRALYCHSVATLGDRGGV